jgi:hypothetical protein
MESIGMVKKRKRAPGGGRKPNPNKKMMFSTRLEPGVLTALKAAAEKWPGQNVSTFAEFLINKGLREREEAKRDPALKGLLFLIAQLAERFGGGNLAASIPETVVRSALQKEWRTDLFTFRAFKIAVGKLLEALEEPPAPWMPITKKQREAYAMERAKKFGDDPAFTKLFLETYKSPESLAAYEFAHFWTSVVKSDLPFTEREREWMRDDPRLGRVVEREYYGFQGALKALELKPEEEDLFEAIKRIMKDRNLSENDPPPPDIREAVKLIADRFGALGEATAGLPAQEGLKLLRSNRPPTLDEALKLLKLEKRKDKHR